MYPLNILEEDLKNKVAQDYTLNPKATKRLKKVMKEIEKDAPIPC